MSSKAESLSFRTNRGVVNIAKDIPVFLIAVEPLRIENLNVEESTLAFRLPTPKENTLNLEPNKWNHPHTTSGNLK